MSGRIGVRRQMRGCTLLRLSSSFRPNRRFARFVTTVASLRLCSGAAQYSTAQPIASQAPWSAAAECVATAHDELQRRHNYGRTASRHREGARVHAASHVCTGTGLAPPTSAPGLGSPFPRLHRDWAHPPQEVLGRGRHAAVGAANERRARALHVVAAEPEPQQILCGSTHTGHSLVLTQGTLVLTGYSLYSHRVLADEPEPQQILCGSTHTGHSLVLTQGTRCQIGRAHV